MHCPPCHLLIGSRGPEEEGLSPFATLVFSHFLIGPETGVLRFTLAKFLCEVKSLRSKASTMHKPVTIVQDAFHKSFEHGKLLEHVKTARIQTSGANHKCIPPSSSVSMHTFCHYNHLSSIAFSLAICLST
jgi:hypothetical protein